MYQLNGDSPLPHCGSHAPNRSMPHIAGSKDARDVGFEDKRISFQGPILRSATAKKQIRTGANKIILILLNKVTSYFRTWDSTDKNKDGIGLFRNGYSTLLVF